MVKTPARSIIGAIDAASARWMDPDFEPRVRARDAACARTGYSLAVVDYAFDRLFGELRADAIEAIVADELGCFAVLDRFTAGDGRPKVRAIPIGRVCIISSRTTIGVAIPAAVFAMCAKCSVLVKDREDYLVASFFKTLAEELPELGEWISARPWSGAASSAEIAAYDAVVAFGDDATLAQLASQLGVSSRFIGYGSKASAGYVTRESLSHEAEARSIARGAALDLTLYEAEGCLSLHTLFVENGGAMSVARFAELLAEALRETAREFPPAIADAAAAARRAAARDLALFRSSVAIHSDRAAGYLIIVDPPFEEPPLFLPQTIGIRAVDDTLAAAKYFARHRIAVEGLAVSGRRNDLLELAASCKAARVAPFGTLQAPPLRAFHGGRPRIAEFVRWLGDET
ncbi:MAG: acyl-CoA reductase [Candidatus Cybelea sp.]